MYKHHQFGGWRTPFTPADRPTPFCYSTEEGSMRRLNIVTPLTPFLRRIIISRIIELENSIWLRFYITRFVAEPLAEGRWCHYYITQFKFRKCIYTQTA